MFMYDGRIVSELRLPKYSGGSVEARLKQVMVKMQEIGI